MAGTEVRNDQSPSGPDQGEGIVVDFPLACLGLPGDIGPLAEENSGPQRRGLPDEALGQVAVASMQSQIARIHHPSGRRLDGKGAGPKDGVIHIEEFEG